MKVIIIGAVAGGATAAARIRRLDENAEIVMLERGGFVSYANCGLPYYVGGIIEDKRALTLQTPESFWARFRVDVRVRNEAVTIDTKGKTVTVRRLDSGDTYSESYDKLILSPGARALRPPMPGIDSPRVFTLRTVEDSYGMQNYIHAHRPQRAVVVGGGFIGLEVAENLIHKGIAVTLVQMENQVMPPLDYDMACQIHPYLREKGIDLRFEETVEGFHEENGSFKVLLKGKASLCCDFAVLAIGVAPDTELAKAAGLELGARGSIVVNDRMETSAPGVYAVGDAVEVRHFVTGEKALIALAGPANKQGRIAADNICGGDSRFNGSQGSSVIKLFDMTVAATGINERQAKAAGMDFDRVVTFSASHATYYPGASNMTIKTLFDPADGRILGAQIVGFDGVDKRIDVLATAIRAGMTSAELEELDLAYAPPYSSAKDPVNMAGFVIENIRKGIVKQFHWHQLPGLFEDKSLTLLDTRTAEEFAQGHFPGAVNIALDELRESLGRLDRTKPIYVNCRSGVRSYIACRILSQNGFDCYNFSGGYRFYESIAKDMLDAAPSHPCGMRIEN